MKDGNTTPPSEHHHHTCPNNSPHFLQQFSLPDFRKAIWYFLLLPKLHRYKSLYCYLNCWILRNFSSDKASEKEAWSHRLVTNGQPATLTTLLLPWSSKPEFWVEISKKSESHLISYEKLMQQMLRAS